MREGC
jgi:hypothetical protein